MLNATAPSTPTIRRFCARSRRRQSHPSSGQDTMSWTSPKKIRSSVPSDSRTKPEKMTMWLMPDAGSRNIRIWTNA